MNRKYKEKLIVQWLVINYKWIIEYSVNLLNMIYNDDNYNDDGHDDDDDIYL